MSWINLIDIVLYTILFVNVIYLFVFAVAAYFKTRIPQGSEVGAPKRVAVLIPAYREDAVIMECVDSCLTQNYSKDKYDIVVISDRMKEETNCTLSNLPIRLIQVFFENSTKSKALNAAMAEIGDDYDVAVVLDADNIVSPDFLAQINAAFQSNEVRIVQAHRCAKNLNTPLALLDAMSEEINNSIFRKGHVNFGLSAALIGSGMAFEYNLFKTTMRSIDAIGGFDRALELTLLRDRVRVYYLPHTDVLDEKIQRGSDFSRQRRRWLSAQLHYLGRTLKHVPLALLQGKWDFCDKVFQQTLIPRIMLLGFTVILTVLWSLINLSLAYKWWVLFGILMFALLAAVPKRLYKKELLMAIIQLPYFFSLMVFNLFRIKGANKKFIHTQHGVQN